MNDMGKLDYKLYGSIAKMSDSVLACSGPILPGTIALAFASRAAFSALFQKMSAAPFIGSVARGPTGPLLPRTLEDFKFPDRGAVGDAHRW